MTEENARAGEVVQKRDAYEIIRDALQGAADAGTSVDSGAGMGSMDFWVKIDSQEYYVNAKIKETKEAQAA